MTRETWDVDECARRFRVQPNTVRDWVRQGLPTTTIGTKGAGNKHEIDPIEAIDWFVDHIGIDVEKTRLAKEQADKIALENAVRRGELGELNVWQRELEQLFGEVRSTLLAIPTKLTPSLVGKDQRAIHAKLTSAVDEALRRLAGNSAPKRRRRAN